MKIFVSSFFCLVALLLTTANVARPYAISVPTSEEALKQLTDETLQGLIDILFTRHDPPSHILAATLITFGHSPDTLLHALNMSLLFDIEPQTNLTFSCEDRLMVTLRPYFARACTVLGLDPSHLSLAEGWLHDLVYGPLSGEQFYSFLQAVSGSIRGKLPDRLVADLTGAVDKALLSNISFVYFGLGSSQEPVKQAIFQVFHDYFCTEGGRRVARIVANRILDDFVSALKHAEPAVLSTFGGASLYGSELRRLLVKLNYTVELATLADIRDILSPFFSEEVEEHPQENINTTANMSTCARHPYWESAKQPPKGPMICVQNSTMQQLHEEESKAFLAGGFAGVCSRHPEVIHLLLGNQIIHRLKWCGSPVHSVSYADYQGLLRVMAAHELTHVIAHSYSLAMKRKADPAYDVIKKIKAASSWNRTAAKYIHEGFAQYVAAQSFKSQQTHLGMGRDDTRWNAEYIRGEEFFQFLGKASFSIAEMLQIFYVDDVTPSLSEIRSPFEFTARLLRQYRAF